MPRRKTMESRVETSTSPSDEERPANEIFDSHQLLEVNLSPIEADEADKYEDIFCDYDSGSDDGFTMETLQKESKLAVLSGSIAGISNKKIEMFEDEQASRSSLGSSESEDMELKMDLALLKKTKLEQDFKIHTKTDVTRFFNATPTSSWNESKNAKLVFKFLNVAPKIVHPNYLLSQFMNFSRDEWEINKLLIHMEETRKKSLQEAKDDKSEIYESWTTVKEQLEEFLSFFTPEISRVVNDFADRKRLKKMLHKFSSNINRWRGSQKLRKDRLLLDECVFLNKTITRLMDTYRPREIHFVDFVKGLINVFRRTVKDYTCFYGVGQYDLKLSSYNEVVGYRDVIPDIVLSCSTGDIVALVGEVKPLAAHGLLYESHRGKKVRRIDSPDELKKTDGETQSNSSTEEPRPSTSHGEEKKEVKKNKELPWTVRNLDVCEKYKVSCNLPQLIGQMLAAMQDREVGISPLDCRYNSVQCGFLVEGFKLRFVKLVLRNYTENKTFKPPYVNEVLKGNRFKTDVFITQEFNLLKREHVEMFFQILMAINYVHTFNNIL